MPCGAGEHCAPAAKAALPLCHADPVLQLLGQFFEQFRITERKLVKEGLEGKILKRVSLVQNASVAPHCELGHQPVEMMSKEG